MERIVILKGDALASFIDYMEAITTGRERVYQLRVTLDENTVKLKANSSTWTPGYGELDPECRAAYPEPNWLRDPTRCANGWHATAPARMRQWCPECPTVEDVPAQARGYRASQEATVRLPATAPTAQAVAHPEPETQPGYLWPDPDARPTY